jgi:hypothetical protein
MTDDSDDLDDLDYDRETYNAYKVQELILGDGAAILLLPEDWTVTRRAFFHARLAVPWIDGASLFVELKTYEDADTIAANDLERFVTGPHLPALTEEDLVYDADGRPDYERVTRRAGGYALPDGEGAPDRREAFRLWRRINVLKPAHIRTIEAHLYIPEEEAESERADEARHVLNEMLRATHFAEYETAADRVASTPALSRIWLWDTICLRVPADWPEMERENPDGSGMYVMDDKETDRWTLWIDYHSYALTDGKPNDTDPVDWARRLTDDFPERQNIYGVWLDPMPDRRDEAAAKAEFGSVEKGEKLRHVAWHKVTRTPRAMILSHFTWVVPEKNWNDPDIVALTQLVEAEALNAVIVDRDAAALEPPAAGSA